MIHRLACGDCDIEGILSLYRADLKFPRRITQKKPGFSEETGFLSKDQTVMRQ
jgi:hypothetical protein